MIKFPTKIIAPLLATLACVLALSSATARDILVGTSVDLYGPNGYIGKDYMNGAKVYFDYVNANGGINGRKIVHMVADNSGSPEKSAEITRDFLTKQHVDVLFGYFGNGSMDALLRSAEFKSSRIPLVAPLSGLDIGSAAGNVYFIRPSYAGEAKKLIDYFVGLGMNRIAAVYMDDGFGKASLAAVEEALKERHLMLSAKHLVDKNGSGLDGAVRSMLAAKPQTILVLMETLPAAQFIKAYRPLDQAAYLAGLSLINYETVAEIAGPANAAGLMIAQVVPHPSNWSIPIVAEHSKIFKIYRDEPPSHLTLEGFIAAKLLVNALRNSGKEFTPTQFEAALKRTRDLDVGGYFLDFTVPHSRGSHYVDINVVTRKGRLLD